MNSKHTEIDFFANFQQIKIQYKACEAFLKRNVRRSLQSHSDFNNLEFDKVSYKLEKLDLIDA